MSDSMASGIRLLRQHNSRFVLCIRGGENNTSGSGGSGETTIPKARIQSQSSRSYSKYLHQEFLLMAESVVSQRFFKSATS